MGETGGVTDAHQKNTKAHWFSTIYNNWNYYQAVVHSNFCDAVMTYGGNTCVWIYLLYNFHLVLVVLKILCLSLIGFAELQAILAVLQESFNANECSAVLHV